MSYLALYRRFRPDTFENMVGQEQVVKTLVNQIKSGRIGHAYLFCGARGTGKTTAARVFARAINCETPVNGSPCKNCETCRKLSDPQNLDIIEIDAASNNKVDNVREIRDKIQYPPVAGKYKVYIIDEAHMLTSEAFNALLKTLEEPPKHAVIIMATTEPHKLPSTILSRCMRFDFRLVPEKTIAGLIKNIYDELGKEYEDEAITEIARAGEGSFRDALSVADTCVSYTDGKLTYADVVEVLGATDNEKVTALARSVLSGDIGEVLSGIDGLLSLGKSASLLARDLSVTLRNMLVIKTAKNAREVLSMAQSRYDSLFGAAADADAYRIFRAEEIFAAVESELKYSTNARVVFETAAVKATIPQADGDLTALASRITKLERALAAVVSNCGAEPKTTALDASKNERKASGSENKPSYKPVKAEFEEKGEPAPRFDPAYSEYAASGENDALSVPPVENQIGIDTDAVSRVGGGEVSYSSESVKSETPRAAEAEGEDRSRARLSDARIWGSVVRKLRAAKNIMLWIACQEQEAKTVDGKFCVFVNSENEYKTIVKPDNLALIREFLAEICDLELKVVERRADAGDGFDKDIEKVKELLGDVKVED